MDAHARDNVERAAREVLETVIGFAVLGLNRVQVERRRLETRCREARDQQRERDRA